MDHPESMDRLTKINMKEKFLASVSQKDWDVICDALLEEYARKRESYSQRNLGDREWEHVDRLYSLYQDILTFVIPAGVS